MTRSDDLLVAALKRLPEKPPDGPGHQRDKKRYSELMSEFVAAALAEELRQRGLREARPGGDGEVGRGGAERRMSGGIGAKRVDVTWATEESGLLLAISVKCLTARDPKTGNYQKNLINRRGDMLVEAVTLHRRFPYAVLGGFMFFDKGADEDDSEFRASTWTLGKHRLMCGDATKPEHVERLLDGAEPDLMVTDPPYGVQYDSSWRYKAGISTKDGAF